MKAKDFFAKMEDVALAIASGVMFILFCNPLSLFVFNLFFPENAARFVREFIGFNDFWRNFYTKCALKWPFWWSRWWITLDNLKTVSVRKQIAYYLDNSNRSRILQAMSSEAQVALVRKYPDIVPEIVSFMRLTDEMFAEWLKHIIKYDCQHCSDIMEMRFVHPFNRYLEQGKLPFSQVMLLTKAVVEEKNAGGYGGLMYDLFEYIERFGLPKKQLKEVAQYMCDNLYWRDPFGEEPKTELAKEFEKSKKFDHFYNILDEHKINYDQRVFTRSQRGEKRTDEWESFCKETYSISVAAQREMDIEQYKIFHATGHTLRVEAIKYFLNYPNRDLHRLVFRYEPSEIFEQEDIRNLIADIHSKAVFDEEMAKR